MGLNNFIKQVFWAQYKSTVKCPNCHHESITFEPYVCLSLPVPVQEKHAVFISVVYRNSARNRKFGIMLDELQSVRQLRVVLAGLSGLYENNIILADLQGVELGRVFYDKQHSMVVNGRHLYALEVPARQVTVDHRTGREVLLIYAVNRCGTLNDGKWFGVPMIFRIHRDLTHYQFQSVLLKTLSKYVQGNVDMFKVVCLCVCVCMRAHVYAWVWVLCHSVYVIGLAWIAIPLPFTGSCSIKVCTTY